MVFLLLLLLRRVQQPLMHLLLHAGSRQRVVTCSQKRFLCSRDLPLLFILSKIMEPLFTDPPPLLLLRRLLCWRWGRRWGRGILLLLEVRKRMRVRRHMFMVVTMQIHMHELILLLLQQSMILWRWQLLKRVMSVVVKLILMMLQWVLMLQMLNMQMVLQHPIIHVMQGVGRNSVGGNDPRCAPEISPAQSETP